MDTHTLITALAQATVERMQMQGALAQAQARIADLEAKLNEAVKPEGSGQ